jgi:hypothetical protein
MPDAPLPTASADIDRPYASGRDQSGRNTLSFPFTLRLRNDLPGILGRPSNHVDLETKPGAAIDKTQRYWICVMT